MGNGWRFQQKSIPDRPWEIFEYKICRPCLRASDLYPFDYSRHLFKHTIMLKLNRRNSIPLRAQVEELLREMARRPEYQSGNLLPNEEVLAAQLGVSRGTIRAGISRLVF